MLSKYEETKFDNNKNNVSSGIFYIVFGFIMSTLLVLVTVYFILKQTYRVKTQLNIAVDNANKMTQEIETIVNNYSKIAPAVEKIFDNEETLDSSICYTLNFVSAITSVGGRELIDMPLTNCTNTGIF